MNCHRTNHNVETSIVKRKGDFFHAVSKVITQHIKVQRPMRYSCHISGETKLKIIDCFKYNDMQNMFKNKGLKPIEKQVVIKPKVSNTSIHIVDVNMAITRSKTIEEQVFKDTKPIKKKFDDDWEEEHRLQQYFVKTI